MERPDSKRAAPAAPRKAWTKPELLVLVRGRPEECLLAGCKYVGHPGPTSGCTITHPLCSADVGS